MGASNRLPRCRRAPRFGLSLISRGADGHSRGNRLGSLGGESECQAPFRPKVLPAGQSVPSRTIPRGGVDMNRPTAAPELAWRPRFTSPGMPGRGQGLADECQLERRPCGGGRVGLEPAVQPGASSQTAALWANRVEPAIPATLAPKRLRTLWTLDTGDNDRGSDFQDFAELEEHLDSRRLLVEFEQADVVARNACACRKGLLRHLRPEPFFAEFIAKHGTRLKHAPDLFCQL